VILQRANGETVDYWERRVSGSVLLEYPLAWRHALFGGYLGQWRSDLEPVPEEVSPPPFTGYWSGVRVGWHYALAEEQDRRIVFPLALGATFYDPLLGSDVRQQIVGGQASAYFPLPVDRGGVYLRALGGWSFGDLLSQRTFYLGGMAQASPLNLNFLNDRFAVRGYDAGVDAGERIATGTAELRFPVAPIERGISTWPIYLRDLHGLVFGDAGFALERNEDLQRDDLFPATGLQLSLETVLFYFVTVDLQTTVAYGFRHPDDTGGFHWLVNLGGLLP
jgi:outer membrane protein assembly factor BamA